MLVTWVPQRGVKAKEVEEDLSPEGPTGSCSITVPTFLSTLFSLEENTF